MKKVLTQAPADLLWDKSHVVRCAGGCGTVFLRSLIFEDENEFDFNFNFATCPKCGYNSHRSYWEILFKK